MTHPITTAAEMRKRCAQIARNHESTYHNAANVCRFIVDQIEAIPVAEPQFDARKRVRHLKRGTFYRVVGPAVMQTADPVCDDTSLVVYQAEKDGSFWVRPTREFEDGRFEDASIAEPQTEHDVQRASTTITLEKPH